MSVKFLHAADIHLDSPLRRLDQYDGAPVEEIREATRRALQNMVGLAIEESVDFVVIAGDLYDGNWKEFRTGLYFVAQMVRLREHGIPVFVIAGNHDAANRMTRSLPLPDNVTLFDHRRPQTEILENLDAAVHGQSFATADVKKNLAAGYPAAVPGLFNIGLLHTSATGREGHERYAPCGLDDLRGKEYDYWALGHVHQREIVCQEPLAIFSGNLQGRHVGETGVKGCTLVTVDDQGRPHAEARSVDVFRWALCRVDAAEAATPADLLDRFRRRLGETLAECDGLPSAVRVEIAGPCEAHRRLAASPRQWTAEVRAAAVDVSGGTAWIEKVKLRTSLPQALDPAATSDGPLGELLEMIAELKSSPAAAQELIRNDIEALCKKLPTELAEGSDALNLEQPEQLAQVLEEVEQLLMQELLTQEGSP